MKKLKIHRKIRNYKLINLLVNLKAVTSKLLYCSEKKKMVSKTGDLTIAALIAEVIFMWGELKSKPS